jgi:hypothetical protein
MSADKTQVGGTHYTDMAVQPWDAMRAWMTPDQFCGYLLGTAVAYLARVNVTAPGKGGIDDIEKARHVLAKLAEAWNYRIFNEFPKEVMCSEPATPGTIGVATLAVSTSAAGDWAGPDWSQAPEWAMWWAKDGDNKRCGCWFDHKPILRESLIEGHWSIGILGSKYRWSPEQNYPGHWRDSLRRRPA